MAGMKQIWRWPIVLGGGVALGVGWLFDSVGLAIVAFPFAALGALLVMAYVEALASPEQEGAITGVTAGQGSAAAGARAGALAESYQADMFNVPMLMRQGNWDAARMAMQKIAYTIKSQPQEKQEQFKQLMTDFAEQDPLVRAGIAAILPAISAQPGQRQTQLYPLLAPLTTEEARYILYFADELGVIRRVKKGNSYLVYPASAGQPELPAP